jgi:polysaccharide export outer membrane protein
MKFRFKLYLYITYVLLFVLFISCETTRRINYLQTPGKGIPSYPQVSPPDDYHLLVGDEINISVHSLEDEANLVFNQGASGNSSSSSSSSSKEKTLYTYTVYGDGCINFPFVGRVSVVGKTLRETSVLLKQKLKGKFILTDFSVESSLINNSFSVITNSGSARFPLTREQMTIFQAIACGMDLPTFADRSHVKIIRQTSDGTIIKEFDIRSKDLLHSEFYYVQANDVIYVQNFNGQFFQLASFSDVYTAITTTIAFGFFILKLTGF